MTRNANDAAWAAVSHAEDAGQGSLASDRAGAITGELYGTIHETALRERRAERNEAVTARARITLNLAAYGTAVEISGVCIGLMRPEYTRLSSAVRGVFEEITGCAAPQSDSFDEPDCVYLDLDPALIHELAGALRKRGYINVVLGAESWAQQVERIRANLNGQYPQGAAAGLVTAAICMEPSALISRNQA